MRLIDALALAGGLDASAGNAVYVIDQAPDEHGQMIRRSLVISLDGLMKGDSRLNVTLGDGAVINVPKAGVVYVEGAVEKPGVYPLQKDTTVLKAVTMAGGPLFKAKRSAVRVLHGQGGGPATPAAVDLDDVKDRPDHDVVLSDGDIVVVEDNALKSAVSGFFGGVRGLFGFGYTLR
jgi:polysaccharide export outer membrane protein